MSYGRLPGGAARQNPSASTKNRQTSTPNDRIRMNS
jgi:hypothetical protein